MLRLESSARLVLDRDLYGALFVLEGSVAIAESIRARPRTARTRDTVLFHPGRERTFRLRNLGHSPVQLVLLRWRPGPEVAS